MADRFPFACWAHRLMVGAKARRTAADSEKAHEQVLLFAQA
ncbi:hypothetical protein [Geobacillus stearothermophilus]|uniref:Transposase n=1 Tax=Geobacillus stearothermophilus TaxID=1422 RepID=A0ABQ7HCB6_GEOSE|nr:hypothetical protein [Geobacillus stearothermophilus]KAF6509838.1 hypothetical protein GS8_1995 [Geobacillus stearothermophilus]MED3731069.1 hypothetical protein [Geobacillus stearothermophilus]MED3749864.1 hypothetical protein [Geobacillus stearothermophilus]OAO79086.1 hypothetical protein TGS27_2256 [Geobacillus stearothermophilus]